eukprot:GHVU01159051.1.p1 GENE.GHVU01159051.1~~GHVU01159051.1.p1  ORF type:complete len:144 (+),score=10.41 GHVU01159051.1:351-782(+)
MYPVKAVVGIKKVKGELWGECEWPNSFHKISKLAEDCPDLLHALDRNVKEHGNSGRIADNAIKSFSKVVEKLDDVGHLSSSLSSSLSAANSSSVESSEYSALRFLDAFISFDSIVARDRRVSLILIRNLSTLENAEASVNKYT